MFCLEAVKVQGPRLISRPNQPDAKILFATADIILLLTYGALKNYFLKYDYLKVVFYILSYDLDSIDFDLLDKKVL